MISGIGSIGIFNEVPENGVVATLANEFLAAGLFFPLILGFFWKRGNTVGAIASIVCGGGFILYGFLVELGVALPHFWEGGATRILLGMAVSGVAYFAGSLLTKPETAKATAFTDLARGRGVGAGVGAADSDVR